MEIKMTEDKKEFKRIDDKELTIIKIELEADRNEKDFYGKVRLTAKVKGDITHKLQKDATESTEVKGFKVTKTKKVPVSFDEIPEVFKRINNILSIKQECKVKLSYTMSEMEYDGDIKKYRFITKSQLSALKILDNSEVEELLVED